MKKNSSIYFWLLIVTSLLVTTSLFSQEAIYTFPDDWMGNFAGRMLILNSTEGVTDTIDVELVLAPTEKDDEWQYTMSYSSKRYGDQVKDYRLIRPDTLPPNVYLTDEQNGIYIQEVLMGNTFYSSFSVGESRLFSTMRNEGDAIYWEIITTRDNQPLRSGTEPNEEGRAFLVNSYLPVATQFVRLEKKE